MVTFIKSYLVGLFLLTTRTRTERGGFYTWQAMRMRKFTTVSVCCFSTGLVSSASVPGTDWLRLNTWRAKYETWCSNMLLWVTNRQRETTGLQMWHTKLMLGLRFPHRAHCTSSCAESLDILSRVHRCSPLQCSRACAFSTSACVCFRLRLPATHNLE